MLGKLCKYEFRATGRVFLPIYAVLLVMSVFTRFFFSSAVKSAITGTTTQTVALTTVFMSAFMFLLFSAVWVITLVMLLRRFWQNILGREGYLSHTLPVHPAEHVGSKLLVSSVWFLASLLASLLAVWIMVGGIFSFIKTLDPSEYTYYSFFNIIKDLWEEIQASGSTTQAIGILVESALYILTSLWAFCLTVYAAMCLGQLSQSHRVWASIGAYIGIRFVQNGALSVLFNRSISSILSSVNALNTLSDSLSFVNRQLLLSTGVQAIWCAIAFFVCVYILQKRLNLQ